MPTREALTVDDIQLGTSSFWARPLDERHAAFTALRERCPVAFHPELEVLEGAPEGPGFWSLTRYEDVRTVNRAAAAVQLGGRHHARRTTRRTPVSSSAR